MPRKPRSFSPNIAYHVISRGNNREDLFRDPEDFEKFLWLISFLKGQYSFELFNYCLMTNHVHLLMRFPDRESFRKVPQRLNLNYARYVCYRYRRVGHVFQDRFRSLPVADNRYLLECARYIERNPVKANMVDDPSRYPWSSHRYYALGEPNQLITPNPMFVNLAEEANDRRSIYAELVRVERPHEEAIALNMFGREWRSLDVTVPLGTVP